MPKKLVFKQLSGRSVPIRKAQSASAVLLRALARKRKPKPSVAKLAKGVKSLKLAAQGSIQMERQIARFISAFQPAGGGAPQVRNQPTNLRPLVWLHQAISAGAQIHSLEYQPHTAPAFSVLDNKVVGTWAPQTFPVTDSIAAGGYGCDPAIFGKYDQLQYQGSQTQGVQSKYTHSSTLYQFKITAQEARGYIDIFMFHPKRSWVRSTQKDVTIPGGLVGFTNLSLGVSNSVKTVQYAINNLYYTKKHLKRHYFNTVDDPGAPDERQLQTNPDYDFQLMVRNDKSRSTIKATELFEGGVLDHTDIPFSKQDWIMVSTTLQNADVSSTNNITVDIIRTPRWRDLLGVSS